ncbi:MAG: DinB family protein [Blastocatellia bacterium]|nr:DinB family protein [Blastocatellia bacterium]
MEIKDIKFLFDYNKWANKRMLEMVSSVDHEQFGRNLSGSFSSIRDTLLHLIGVELLWLKRWKGESLTAMPQWGEAPSLETLKNALDDIEKERDEFLSALTEESLKQTVSFKNLKGEAFEHLLTDLFLHLVNHSTYHRGQVANMVRQVGSTAISTDLIVFKNELLANKV